MTTGNDLQADTLSLLNGAKGLPKSNLIVRFIPEGKEDWVEYTYKDQSKDRILRPVQQKDIERYPKLWGAYCADRPVTLAGTDLVKVPTISANIATIFRLHGVRTVEELANTDLVHAQKIMSDGDEYVKVAKMYLATMKIVTPDAKPEAKPEAKKAA